MPQFLVTARDGSDPEAPARRAAARPAHLEGIGRLGVSMIVGGAMLDHEGTPFGSTMIVEFPDRAALEAWIAADPYTTGGVWRSVEVVPFRVAVERGAESESLTDSSVCQASADTRQLKNASPFTGLD